MMVPLFVAKEVARNLSRQDCSLAQARDPNQWKITNTAAVHIISAVADALGHRIDELVLNRTTIERMRREYRKTNAKKIMDNFSVI